MNHRIYSKLAGVIALPVMISLCHGPAFGAVPSTQATHTPFMQVLLKDFDAWDVNHDGELSVDEINRLIVDPSLKGDDAAAAASIKLILRSNKYHLPPLTRDYFNQYEHKELSLSNKPDAVNATIDTVASASEPAAGSTTQPTASGHRLPTNFDLYYEASKARMARGGPDPLPGRFDLDHTRQGPMGDCFLVSSSGSFAYQDPDRFKNVIVPLKTGGYEVHFPATQPITVPAPTDAELAISGTTAGDGIWLAIIEQAFGKYRAKIKGDLHNVESTDLITTGGAAMQALGVLTGHQCIRLKFANTVEARKANADSMLPKLRQQLITTLAAHRGITCGVNGRASNSEVKGTPLPIPPNITTNHAYAVLSYDPKTDVLELWNPHGQQFDPKGPPGILNGYPTEHGRFKLPLTEAYQFVSAMGFEQAEPANDN